MPRMKFLSLTALFALCLVCSGAALAADSWDVTADLFPASLVWDASQAVSVDTNNDGTTSWTDEYKLLSVDGPTGAAMAVNRWGVIAEAVGATVAPTATYAFDFAISAPPISTLSYAAPVGPTTPPVVSTLDCNWILADGADALIETDISANAVTVTRFSDSDWATPYVEQCAGRLPAIVGGYSATRYRPEILVTRDQMAVFVQRAFQLPAATYAGRFADVAVGYWADDSIEACYLAGIVGGYADGYRPLVVVTRDQMAVFVARSMAGGEVNVPSGPATARFTDVPVGFWAYNHVEYCVANNVVGGYSPTIYRPALAVDRGQMAVFVYRSAIQPTSSMVVLAGPAITTVDPVTAGYDGWTSAASGADIDPGYAYVGLDALRGPSSSFDVTFELQGPESPTPTATVTIDGAAAKAAAAASGIPYVYASWEIPAGLAVGDYTLVVTVDGNVVGRQPAFTIFGPG